MRWQNITNISPFFFLILTYQRLLTVALLFHKWEEDHVRKLSIVCLALLVTNLNTCGTHFKFALTDEISNYTQISTLLFFGGYGNFKERLRGLIMTTY